MTVTVHITADADDLDLVAQALDEGADRRRRAGIQASAELTADQRAGADVTTQALLVVDVLAKADTLGNWANALRTASTAQPARPPATSTTALDQALAAVEAAKAHVPTILELADQHNAALAAANGAQPATPAAQINGAPVWVAPLDVLDDDDLDEPGADDLGADVTLDMRP